MKHKFLLSICVLFLELGLRAQENKVELGIVMLKLTTEAEAKLGTFNPSYAALACEKGKLVTVLPSVDAVLNNYGVYCLARVYEYDAKFDNRHRAAGLHLHYYALVDSSADVFEVARLLEADANIESAHARMKVQQLRAPERLQSVQRVRQEAAPKLLTPAHHKTYAEGETLNDPDFGKQWNLYNNGQGGGFPGVDIGLLPARDYLKENGLTAKNKVGIAVFDGGFNINHEDLKDNLWTDAKYDASTRTSSFPLGGMQHGFCFGIHPHSFGFVVPFNEMHMDAHGTHVAGIIAASSNNEKGVAGIATVLGDNPIELFSATIIGENGIAFVGTPYTYLADYTDIVIAQNSWAYSDPNDYQPEDYAGIKYFIENAGKNNPNTPMTGGLVVFAASNDKKEEKYYPAAFPEVLSVAAVTNKGAAAAYTNYGDWVDIAAPGGELYVDTSRDMEGIWSTYLDKANTSDNAYYAHEMGTSMACPHVSGVAALILAVEGSPAFTPEMLRERLLKTAIPLDKIQQDDKFVGKLGSGLVNLYYALKNEVPEAFEFDPNPAPEEPDEEDNTDPVDPGEETPDTPEDPKDPADPDTPADPKDPTEPGDDDNTDPIVPGDDPEASVTSADIHFAKSVALYPNPVEDILEITGLPEGKTVLQVLTLSGKLVMETILSGGSARVDVSQLPSATYLVKMQSGVMQHTVKVVKN